MKTDFFKKYNIPTTCPVCGGKVEINSSGMPFCANENCDQKVVHQILNFSDIFQIKGIGVAFTERWVKVGKKNFVDLLEEIKKSNDGDKSATDFICEMAEGINGKKIVANSIKALTAPISTSEALAMFDFDGFGATKLRVFDGKTIEEIGDLTEAEVAAYPGWSAESAKDFKMQFMSKYNEVKRFLNMGICKFKTQNAASQTGGLAGLSFCFTGALNSMKRADAEKLVRDNNGNVAGVSKNLSYLVNNDIESTSGKNKKAKELGIKIIDEEQFFELLKDKGVNV